MRHQKLAHRAHGPWFFAGLAVVTAVVLALGGCAGSGQVPGEAAAGSEASALERYLARREAAFDAIAEIVKGECAAFQDGAACADGTVDLDRWGAELPVWLGRARDDYCGLLEGAGTAGAIARGALVYRVNRALRARGAPVFRAGVCDPPPT